jgi:hypothetical protein
MMVGQVSGADGRLPIRSFGHGVGGFAISFIHFFGFACVFGVSAKN